MDLPIPPNVIYAGLGGCVLALIVATIQQKWQVRVFFILALRLAIGWHFAFEGMNKIHSHMVGVTETSRPFSSEPYFRESEGPIADLLREKYLDDPEAKMLALVQPPTKLATVGDFLGSSAESLSPRALLEVRRGIAFLRQFQEQRHMQLRCRPVEVPRAVVRHWLQL